MDNTVASVDVDDFCSQLQMLYSPPLLVLCLLTSSLKQHILPFWVLLKGILVICRTLLRVTEENAVGQFEPVTSFGS